MKMVGISLCQWVDISKYIITYRRTAMHEHIKKYLKLVESGEEKNLIMKHLNEFQIGIEFEYHPHDFDENFVLGVSGDSGDSGDSVYRNMEGNILEVIYNIVKEYNITDYPDKTNTIKEILGLNYENK